MSDQQETNRHADPTTRPFLEFWTSYIEQANAATKSMFENLNVGQDAQAWQRRWFDAVSQSLDCYLRSPAFLQSMKSNTDAMIKAKMQADQMLNDFARQANIPTAGHVGELSEQLRRVEEAIISRLQEVEQRLQRMEIQLGMPSKKKSKQQ